MIFDINARGRRLRSQREQIGFIDTGAVETPGTVGQRLDQLLFDDALRFQIIEKALGETPVCDEIILGRDDRLTAEGVTHGIEA